MDTVIYTEEELQIKCAEWQKVLRLQDWIINVKLSRLRDMSDTDLNAEIRITLANRIALILILDPIDYDPDNVLPQDMEQYLVHELLHIHLYPITGKFTDGPLQIAEEQAIEAISKGLIALRRGSEGEVVRVAAGEHFHFKTNNVVIDSDGPATIIFKDMAHQVAK
ncbi:hypothetical protein MKX70_24085 [Paenibacillus sp. FSL R7-0312]|uniref:hypothetical protein n=1 Tax=Paenibacillus sp. FSL R7-0312 TaxID=2921682 RepID=UPI0030F8EAB8